MLYGIDISFFYSSSPLLPVLGFLYHRSILFEILFSISIFRVSFCSFSLNTLLSFLRDLILAPKTPHSTLLYFPAQMTHFDSDVLIPCLVSFHPNIFICITNVLFSSAFVIARVPSPYSIASLTTNLFNLPFIFSLLSSYTTSRSFYNLFNRLH